MKAHRGKIALGVVSSIIAIVIAIALAAQVATDARFAEWILSLGYFGIFLAAYISGFNLFIPISAATFVPVFTTAGFPIGVVIAFIVSGTVLADLTAYLLGYYGKRLGYVADANWYVRMKDLVEKHKRWVVPVVFVYAAAVPIPNEVVIIPLALLGYRAMTLLVPLVLGTIIHVTIVALSAEGLFTLVNHSLETMD